MSSEENKQADGGQVEKTDASIQIIPIFSGIPVQAGDAGQMPWKATEFGRVVNVEVESGAVIDRLSVGTQTFIREGNRSWLDTLGPEARVAKGQYVIARAVNTTQEPKRIEGRIYLSPTEAPKQPLAPSPESFSTAPAQQAAPAPVTNPAQFVQQVQSQLTDNGPHPYVEMPTGARVSVVQGNGERFPGQTMNGAPQVVRTMHTNVTISNDSRPGGGPTAVRSGDLRSQPHVVRTTEVRPPPTAIRTDEVRPQPQAVVSGETRPAPRVDVLTAAGEFVGHADAGSNTSYETSTGRGDRALSMVLPNENEVAIMLLTGIAQGLHRLVTLKIPLKPYWKIALMNQLEESMKTEGALGVNRPGSDLVLILDRKLRHALLQHVQGRGPLVQEDCEQIAKAIEDAAARDSSVWESNNQGRARTYVAPITPQ